MRRRIFVRFFALICCAVALVFGGGLFAVRHNSEKIIKERLMLESEILLHLLKNEEDVARLDPYQNKEDFRLTITDSEGRVLSESSIVGVLEENHSGREEIQSALDGVPKMIERYSDTFGCRMTYYAVPASFENGDRFVLRLAVRSGEISEYIGLVLPLMIGVLIIALVISGVFADKLSVQLAEKVKAVADGLRTLNEGSYTPIETNQDEAEFSAVFLEINELNEKTHEHMCSLEHEQKKLSAVLDNISQGIVALDIDKRIVFANPGACALFSKDAQGSGSSLSDFLADSELFEKIVSADDKHIAFEHTFGGKELSVSVRYIGESDRTSVSTILIFTDITREKNMAKEKSDFFANASHELKTPLTVMLGLSEIMLAKAGIEQSMRGHLERIHRESSRMADLIADMLALSGLERGARTEKISLAVDMRRVADDVINELAPKLAEKQLSAAVKGKGSIKADPKQMYELIANICSNAVNYNKEGGSVEVELSESSEALTLCVKDSGIGIADEHIPRLCERFYRVDKSRSKKTGGTGLGLAIVKHICILNNAELKIESKLSVGTIVTVVFAK